MAIDLAGHATQLDNMIAVQTIAAASATGPAMYSYANIESARTHGVDGTASWDAAAHTSIRAQLSRLWTYNAAEDRPLSGRPDFTSNLGATHSAFDERLTATWSYGWQSPTVIYLYSTTAGGFDSLTAPAWHLVDARVAWQLGRRGELHAGADNLLDTGDLRLAPSRPRRVYAGLSWSGHRASYGTDSKGGDDASI
jgi:outer membrane receptor for ferrienterochelin and colicin